MANPPPRPGAKAQHKTPSPNIEPLARGYGDEHGGYVVDAQAEHTTAAPGDAAPIGKDQADSDTQPGRGATAAGTRKRG